MNHLDKALADFMSALLANKSEAAKTEMDHAYIDLQKLIGTDQSLMVIADELVELDVKLSVLQAVNETTNVNIMDYITI